MIQQADSEEGSLSINSPFLEIKITASEENFNFFTKRNNNFQTISNKIEKNPYIFILLVKYLKKSCWQTCQAGH